jgi:hypothetical protein
MSVGIIDCIRCEKEAARFEIDAPDRLSPALDLRTPFWLCAECFLLLTRVAVHVIGVEDAA